MKFDFTDEYIESMERLFIDPSMAGYNAYLRYQPYTSHTHYRDNTDLVNLNNESEARRTRCGNWRRERQRLLSSFKEKMREQLHLGRYTRPAWYSSKPLAAAVAKFARNQTMETLNGVADVLFKEGVGTKVREKLRLKFSLIDAYLKQDAKMTTVWKETPFDDMEWFRKSSLYWVHAPHVSEEDRTMIAYTQSLDKLQRGIQTRTKPGRYLRQFFPHLNDEQIREFSALWDAATAPAKLEFISNKDPEGWIEAYNHSVSASSSGYTSCMTGKRCVRVYAHPSNNLSLAVLRETSGSVIARAICNTERKAYVRSYTDTSKINHHAFEQILEDAGYELDSDCLRGEKLQRIEDGSRFVCPYLDGDYQYVEDYGSYLVITDEGIEARNTNGYSDDSYESYTCDECGGRCNSDDMTFIEGEDISVCSDCLDDFVEARYGNSTRIRWRWMRASEAIEFNGTYYDPDDISNFDICECNHCNEYAALDDMTTLACGELVCSGCLHSSAVVKLDVESSSEGSNYAFKCDTETLPDGRVVYEDDYDDLLVEYEAENATDEDESEDESETEATTLPSPPAEVVVISDERFAIAA